MNLMDDQLASSVQAVREFNRFYTRQIGVLHEGLLESQFSLTEVRVLYEIAHGKVSAREIAQELELDPAYLSRILRGFQVRGLIRQARSTTDRRQRVLALTNKGQEVFRTLDHRSSEEVGKVLDRLRPGHQRRLLRAMRTIEELLGGGSESTKAPYLIRPPQAGDIGWVVHRHGVLYAEEYGFDEHFEALVAGIVAEFIEKFDPRRERSWIAEREGENVGSVFLVKASDELAKLRLLLVEPSARGLGIGKQLVAECIRFARRSGYRKITLWTQSELVAARRIYEQAGFRLVEEKPHHSWGRDLVAEVWELEL